MKKEKSKYALNKARANKVNAYGEEGEEKSSCDKALLSRWGIAAFMQTHLA